VRYTARLFASALDAVLAGTPSVMSSTSFVALALTATSELPPASSCALAAVASSSLYASSSARHVGVNFQPKHGYFRMLLPLGVFSQSFQELAGR